MTHYQQDELFNSKKESLSSKFNRIQTNERYAHFKQTHYTVGDEDQFDEIISSLEEVLISPVVMDKLNIYNEILHFDFWEGFKNQERINVIQTFRYLFYKFKKGIYIRIQNNKLFKFIPLSNANFVNEWSEQIEVDYSIFKKVCELENRPYNDRNVNKFVQNWFCNNCLLRYEYPINESDTNVSNIKNLFEELCEKRKVPDIEFFVNKRDFPLLTRNSTEPYYDIWGDNKPLVSHQYSSYLPILSMSKTTEFADILLPTHEDWARVKQKEKKWFINSRVDEDFCSEKEFKQKIPTAVFRGSSTGEGFTIETNQRLKLAYLSSLAKVDKRDNIPYLDCGITKWNSRVKKTKNSKKIQMIDIASLPFSLTNYMPLSEQCLYKYIIHVDGHVSAFRLSTMLTLNCVSLIVQSPWKMWYSDLLVPYEHYVPIKSDLSDLFEQIQWCKDNDDACEWIARNAQQFAEKYLEKDGILDYTQKLLMDLKSFMRFTPSPTITSFVNTQTYPLPPHLSTIIANSGKIIVFENKNVIIHRIEKHPLIIKERKKKSVCSRNIFPPLCNFSTVFGYTPKNDVVMEYVEGIKLYDFIADKELFDFQVYVEILVQICLALHVAQKEILFVHNDMTPWNIILKFHEHTQHLTYDENNFHVYSKVVPMIIDYDKSHIVDTNFHHQGSVNAYRFSSIQDVLTLLFTSLYQIISVHKLSFTELKSVLKIANFISYTTFYPKSFKSIHELKGYLFSMKKHSSLIYTNKLDLEYLGPLDLVFYLKKHIPQQDLKFLKIYHHVTKNNISSFAETLTFDKYTFWSASKCKKLYDVIQSTDIHSLPSNLSTKKLLADATTFISIYK